MMKESEARKQTIKLFGEDSFTERDFTGGMTRYYVGPLPKTPGPYTGFMGFSWEEALDHARRNHKVAGVRQEDVDAAEN
jgi:hypothetical protein